MQWVKEGLATGIKTGIILGKDGKALAPKDDITRALVAVTVRELLQKSGLI